MNVGTQPLVISQIPAIVVWVLIDHDLVAIPEPVIAEVEVVCGDAEVETTKPETLPVSSSQAEDMAAAESASKASVFPRMIDVVVGIITAGIMSDPLIVRVNVGSFRMSPLVRKSAVFLSGRLVVPGWPLFPGRSGTMRRNVSARPPPCCSLPLPCGEAGTENIKTSENPRAPVNNTLVLFNEVLLKLNFHFMLSRPVSIALTGLDEL